MLVETILGPGAAAHLQGPAAQSSSEALSVVDLAREPPHAHNRVYGSG